MNLFELFVNHNQRAKEKAGIVTTATFTGKRNIAGTLTRMKTLRKLDYYEYEIEYFANGEKRKGYFTFSPLPDPEPEEVMGTTIQIRYNKKKPYIFEKVIELVDEENE